MSQIRVVIVEDEYLARERMKELAGEHGDVAIVGEAATGQEAVLMIEDFRPDLVLLDISLPVMNGFDVLNCLEMSPLPLVVFTSAYDEHAIRAFDIHAIDYLLKPIERERFAASLQRVRDILALRAPRVENAVREFVAREARRSSRLIVRTDGRIVFLRPSEIDWISSVGNYVKIHRGNDRLLVRQALSAIEERLRDNGFVRIQRSVLVNAERVAEIRREGKGMLWVVLSCGTRFRLSERYREQLEKRIAGV